jgi:hypothetical protein
MYAERGGSLPSLQAFGSLVSKKKLINMPGQEQQFYKQK